MLQQHLVRLQSWATNSAWPPNILANPLAINPLAINPLAIRPLAAPASAEVGNQIECDAIFGASRQAVKPSLRKCSIMASHVADWHVRSLFETSYKIPSRSKPTLLFLVSHSLHPDSLPRRRNCDSNIALFPFIIFCCLFF
jgi:hypothetical protein